MKNGYKSYVLLFIFFVSSIIACEKYYTTEYVPEYNPPEETVNPLDLTPRENEEAEWAALYLSGEIVAPDSLYNHVLSGIYYLLERYSDSIPEAKIRFYYPTFKSDLDLAFTDSAKAKIRSGEYHAWDSLNTFYRVTEVDTVSLMNMFIATLRFAGRLNPSLLCEKYSNLPGIWNVSPSFSQVGDGPKKYAKMKDGQLSFLIRNAWDDCQAGCMSSHYFYFRQSKAGMDYVGDWNPRITEDSPTWWDEAYLAKQEYDQYFEYFCQSAR